LIIAATIIAVMSQLRCLLSVTLKFDFFKYLHNVRAFFIKFLDVKSHDFEYMLKICQKLNLFADNRLYYESFSYYDSIVAISTSF